MEWKQLVIDIFQQRSEVLGKALSGLTQGDLDYQPHPDSNNIGWLAWHLTRTQDKAIANIAGEEQLWMTEEWYSRFNRTPDPSDTGFGHSSEDVASFRSPDVETILEYHQAVLGRSKEYFGGVIGANLGQAFEHPKFHTVGARLVALINDNLQHVGQIAYLRGLLGGKGWLGV